MLKNWGIWFVLGFLAMVGGVSGATNVSSCQQITSPGVYVLNQSITNSTYEWGCIEITVSNVIFDGAGYTIDGVDDSVNETYGVYLFNDLVNFTNITVKNLKVTDWGTGIKFDEVENSTIENNTASSNINSGIRLHLDSKFNNVTYNNASNNNQYGIYLDDSSNSNILTNNTANSNNQSGIRLNTSSNNIFTNNTASLNGVNGIYLENSSGNAIYDNRFNNTANSYFNNTLYTNSWNTTLTAGTNIVGGPNLGGNFWAYPNGTGASETCTDADGDGICDSYYNLTSGNVDYLPLSLNFINVCSSGCDYTTIQAAINAANTGATINVSADTYTENVNVNKSVNLVGAGAGVTTVQAASSSDHVFYVTASSVNISGLTAKGATGLGKVGIYLYNSNYSKIENVNASNNNRGIYLYTSSNNTLTNNTANSNYYGIYLYTSSNYNTLTNNTANSNTPTGIYLYTSSNYNTLTNNNANSNTEGIYLDESNNNTLTDNTASNNSYGIYIDYSTNNTLTNNTANSNTQYGISLYSSSNSNTLTDNTANSNTQYGIYLTSSSNNTIANNTANSNSYGIYLFASRDNTIYNNTAGSNSYTGIYLISGSNNNTIDSNTVRLNYLLDFSGIHVQDSNNNTIVNNDASKNDYGIYLLNSNYTNITKNNVSYQDAGTKYGIYLTASNSNTIADNIANNNNYGIYLGSSSNNTLTNNTANSNTNYGIRLTSSSNSNTMSNNTMKSNGWDFYSTSSSSNTVNSNLFTDTRASFTYSGDIKVNSSSSPGSNLQGYSDIGKYLNITNSSSDAWVFLNVSYTDEELGTAVNESTLWMYRYNGAAWESASGTNGVDTSNNYVYANLTSFSVFAPMGIDDVPPEITITSPQNTTYNTFDVDFNITVSEPIDANAGVLIYYIDGGAAPINISLVNDSLTHWYNDTVNLSDYNMSDGQYNATFNVTDLAGNSNTSTVWFTIDTTPPNITGVSSGSITTSMATITWTTNESANTTVYYGTNTSTASTKSNSSFVTNHSITLSGLSSGTTYYYNVSSCDVTGNCNTSSQYSFATTSSSSPSAGGGGGTPPAKDQETEGTITTPTEADVVVQVEATFSSIPKDKTGTIAIPETEDMPLTEMVIKVKNKVTNVEIVVKVLTSKPAEVAAEIAGEVLKYLKVEHTNIEDDDIDSVMIAFKVPVSWINDNDIDMATVVLSRYADDKWMALTTTKTNESSDYVYYSANSSGLSVFGVSGEVRTVTTTTTLPVTTTVPATVAPATTTPPPAPLVTTVPPAEKPKSPVGKIILAILVITIIAGAAYYTYQKKKCEEECEVEAPEEVRETAEEPAAEEPEEGPEETSGMKDKV